MLRTLFGVIVKDTEQEYLRDLASGSIFSRYLVLVLCNEVFWMHGSLIVEMKRWSSSPQNFQRSGP